MINKSDIDKNKTNIIKYENLKWIRMVHENGGSEKL